jgi:hypothetical protein
MTVALIIRSNFRCVKKSNIPSEFPNATFEGFGNLRERFQRDFLFRPFDVANVIPRQIGFFSKLFLAQASLLPPAADGFSQKAINFARG